MKLFFRVLSFLVVIGITLYFLMRNNFHTVIPSEVYRSAQLSPSALEDYVTEYGIGTVINLRGPQPQKDWYQAEKEITERLSVTHHDIAINSTRVPRIDQLLKLFYILETTKKPILVHCEGGADRAGLVSTIILLLDGKQGLSEINEQLSWQYRVFKDQSTGIIFLNKYLHWLKIKNLPHNPIRFINWVKNDYVDASGGMRFYIDFITGKLRDFDKEKDLYTYDIDRTKEELFVVDGWAFDHVNNTLLPHVEILIDETPVKTNVVGRFRPDVAEYFGNDIFSHSGWAARDLIESFPDGCHNMALRLYKTNGGWWTSPPKAVLCISS